MARTTRRNKDNRGRELCGDAQQAAGVRPWYRREAKFARKQTNRAVRNANREVLATTADHDAMIDPRPRRTGGWLTH
jgi:hypothetical protein